MIVLSIDPSGNFEEGKGHTGYVLMSVEETGHTLLEYGTLKADDYATRTDYWYSVVQLIENKHPDLLVVEDYRLYNTSAVGARTQSFSLLETPRLIGVIEMTAKKLNVQLKFQMAVDTKPYADDIMVKLEILNKQKGRYYYKGVAFNDHERSALRHFLRWYDRRNK